MHPCGTWRLRLKTLLTLLVDITIGLGLALGLGVLSSGQPSLQAAVFSSQHAVLSCWWKAMCERALAASSLSDVQQAH